MDPEQNGPKPISNNPLPQVIKPDASAGGDDSAGYISRSPAPDIPPVSPPQPPAPMPAPTPPQPPAQPPDTSKLFQPDSKLPEINLPAHGNLVVDNRPPRGIKNFFKKNKLPLLAPLAVIILALGVVFGYYLPNRPSAVWNTGLDRSGQALDKLLTQATDKQQLDKFQKTEIKATIDIKAQGGNFSGSLASRFDDSKADGSLSFTTQETGAAAKALTLKFLSELPAGATYPDSFIQVSGVKVLGLDLLVPGIGDYDGKWISVEAKYLKSLGLPDPSDDKSQVNADDVSELVKSLSSVSKDYIFTSNKDRAVIKQKSFVGKEKTDGITAYHYTAGIDKAHAKDLCRALSEKIASTNAYKKFSKGGNADFGLFFVKSEDKEKSIKECQNSVDKMKDSNTFDVWIDGKYKLIHKIRFTDEKDKDTYTDIGQNYKGGDDISLFVAFHSGKENMDASFTVDSNTKTVASKGVFNIKGGSGSSAYEGKVEFEIKPLSGDINIQKPANAIPISDVLKKFGVDPDVLSSSSTGQSTAKDAKIKSDINSIQSHLEVYFAQNGYYPSLNQLNDSAWRSANMRGFDNDSLGSSGSLAKAATAARYGYAPGGCNSSGEQCTSFTLEAILSTGKKFTKLGSNN